MDRVQVMMHSKIQPVELRDYQNAAVDALWRYFIEGGKGNPIVAMPTGTGKSLTIARAIQTMVTAYPGTYVMVLTHVKELIQGNHDALRRLWPSAPTGIFSAGLNRKDFHAQITFAGIASVRNRPELFRRTGVVFVDECHLVSDNESASYQKFFAELRKYNPQLKVIGFSATPWRMGLGRLTEGSVFTDTCFDLTSGEAFLWLLDKGYLAPLVPKRTTAQLDTDAIVIRGGEFQQSSVDEAFAEQGVTLKAIQETLAYAGQRHHWLVFASSLAHGEEVRGLLAAEGIPTGFVHSKLSAADRDAEIARFKSGQYRALVNKDILTTGFDFPEIDCIVMLRPTQSPGLWVQMLGRGTRPAPGKKNCLVLDFAGNTERLGPINYPTLPKRRGKGGGEPPVRVCPECATFSHISVHACPECGFVFPVLEKLLAFAGKRELIAKAPPPLKQVEKATFSVHRVLASRHQKAGKPDSVRVDYFCGKDGVRRFSTWVAIDHGGGALGMATRWWRMHSLVKGAKMPGSTTELLERWAEVRAPTHIEVIVSSKYPEITSYDFTGTNFFADPERLQLVESAGDAAGAPEDSGADRSSPLAPELSDMSDFY